MTSLLIHPGAAARAELAARSRARLTGAELCVCLVLLLQTGHPCLSESVWKGLVAQQLQGGSLPADRFLCCQNASVICFTAQQGTRNWLKGNAGEPKVSSQRHLLHKTVPGSRCTHFSLLSPDQRPPCLPALKEIPKRTAQTDETTFNGWEL